jgi:proteasome lid subunit RPN8/RPN11
VRLARRSLEQIVDHARGAAPAECCGLLIGSPEAIVDAVRARNLSADPNRFLLDPRDHIAARRAARARGLAVVGFYHSHPHSPAYPSPTDIAEAAYPESVQMIVSLETGAPCIRLFRIAAGAVDSVGCEVSDDAASAAARVE